MSKAKTTYNDFVTARASALLTILVQRDGVDLNSDQAATAVRLAMQLADELSTHHVATWDVEPEGEIHE